MKSIEEWNPIKGYNDLINYFKSQNDTPDNIKSDIEWCNKQFSTFPAYVSSVMNAMLESDFDIGTDRENYIDDIEKRDRDRRFAHENVISACSYFNRMCDRAGLPRFCPDIPEDKNRLNRELIGEFANYVTAFVFNAKAGIADDNKIKVMKENIIDMMNRSF